MSNLKEEFPDYEILIRLPEVLRIIPVCRATWWNGVKDGRFPASIKLSDKITCWKLSEVLALINRED